MRAGSIPLSGRRRRLPLSDTHNPGADARTLNSLVSTSQLRPAFPSGQPGYQIRTTRLLPWRPPTGLWTGDNRAASVRSHNPFDAPPQPAGDETTGQPRCLILSTRMTRRGDRPALCDPDNRLDGDQAGNPVVGSRQPGWVRSGDQPGCGNCSTPLFDRRRVGPLSGTNNRARAPRPGTSVIDLAQSRCSPGDHHRRCRRRQPARRFTAGQFRCRKLCLRCRAPSNPPPGYYFGYYRNRPGTIRPHPSACPIVAVCRMARLR